MSERIEDSSRYLKVLLVSFGPKKKVTSATIRRWTIGPGFSTQGACRENPLELGTEWRDRRIAETVRGGQKVAGAQSPDRLAVSATECGSGKPGCQRLWVEMPGERLDGVCARSRTPAAGARSRIVLTTTVVS